MAQSTKYWHMLMDQSKWQPVELAQDCVPTIRGGVLWCLPSRINIVLPVFEKKCLKFTDEHSLYTHTYTLITVHNETHICQYIGRVILIHTVTTKLVLSTSLVVTVRMSMTLPMY